MSNLFSKSNLTMFAIALGTIALVNRVSSIRRIVTGV